jgi:hypothetical protein
MFDTEKMHHGILDFIGELSANGESGKLRIVTGATSGALLFNKGKLVDARVGHLTGFPAINAIAAMPDARFSFDSSVVPPAFSTITPSERVVLKQFFGIETLDPRDDYEPAILSWPIEEAKQPDNEDLVDRDLIAVPDEEATLVTSKAPNAAELPTALPYMPPPRTSFPRALTLGVLAMAIAAAVVLVYLFRDGSSPAPVASATTTESSSHPVAEPAVAERAVSEATVPASKGPVPSVAPRAVPEPSAPASAPVQVEETEETAHAARDLTGRWNVVNTIETTSYRSYKNLKIGFDLSINQTGTSFTGRGQKISENGQILPASSRTPIEVKGSIHGDRIEATFYEEGSARKTNGRFVWRVDKAGRLTGIFATTAARSSGKSAARRDF